MKTLFCLVVFSIATLRAFSQTQTVTFAVGGNLEGAASSQCYPLSTNQIVKIVSIQHDSAPAPTIALYFPSGMVFATTNAGTFTGITNLMVNAQPTEGVIYFPGLVTFEVTTPSPQIVISNYVPADAIVIPSSAHGNVQIILESSPDLVNWTAANPGTYSAADGTNRFFRVRAVTGN